MIDQVPSTWFLHRRYSDFLTLRATLIKVVVIFIIIILIISFITISKLSPEGLLVKYFAVPCLAVRSTQRANGQYKYHLVGQLTTTGPVPSKKIIIIQAL